MSNLLRQPSEWSRRLVEALTAAGLLDQQAGVQVLGESADSGRTASEVLAERALVDTATVRHLMARVSGFPEADIAVDRPSAEALVLMPPEFGTRYGAIGYRVDQGRLTLACVEPLSLDELRSLSVLLDCEVGGCVIADPAAIERARNLVQANLGANAQNGDGHVATSAMATSAAMTGTGSTSAMTMDLETPIGDYGTFDGGFDTPLDDGGFDFGAEAEEAPAPAEVVTLPPGFRPLNDRPRTFEEIQAGKPAVDIDDLLIFAVEHGASDLHLTTGVPPVIRVDGFIRPIEGLPPLENETIREMVYSILTQALRERFEAGKELDTSHSVHGFGRFRVNVSMQRGSVSSTLRAIPHEIPAFEVLGLPEVIATFANLRRGLVLVTGPTGSGKSTTLASLLDIINRSQAVHIVTIEDPIEFLHTHRTAIVNQREVGVDTASFSEALRRVLRQDPDVILVGEMRDLETIQTALTAAETGHLVFATLHTQDAPQTIDRIIDVFPTNQQDQIRIQLATTLQAVMTQQLMVSTVGAGRVPVCEIMIATPAVQNLIRGAKTHQIYSIMQTSRDAGMQTMDQGLARAVKAGAINEAVAFERCTDPKDLREHLKD